ncbi:MAG: glycoside hydrolase family 127 protein [Terracidiphilus sp.]|nr:glycoside hydrolase family 127 protein [Terracidiphilus sp.]
MNTSISRRTFLAGAAAAAVAAQSPLARAASAPVQSFEEFPLGAVQLTGGPLKQQYDRTHATYLALDSGRLLKVYRQRAGLPAPDADMGGWYDAGGFVPGHTLGQYISGLARIGKATGDQACHEKVHQLVEGFATTLGSKNQVFAGPNAEKLWPCYILDKHLQGLVDAYESSGVAEARALLPRVFQGALPFIPEKGRDRIGKKDPPYDETFIMPETLFAAHELTGDPVFRQRALTYLLDREFFDPLARGENVLPGQHAYSHAIALSSAGKAHLVLRDEKYLRAMQTAAHLLETDQQYASGGWGPNETFIEPHKGQLYQSLGTTEDHFETPCGSYAALKLARYLLCATGDAHYADSLERVLFNTLLAVKDPDSDGSYPYYSTYGGRARKVYYQKKWPCCSGTLVEGVADYVRDLYFHSLDGIAIAFYAPSELRWTRHGSPLTLTQETAYPLDSTISLKIGCAAPSAFALRLRIPAWTAGKHTITVNGAPVHPPIEKGFALLHRTWMNGDKVTLNLPLDFRTEPIDDLHPNTVALMRGPLLYVQLNPPTGSERLANLDALRALDKTSGVFAEQKNARVHVPFYFVQNETYTTYFEKR